METKTITVTLTSEEVDVLEDVLWCKLTDEQLVKNQPYRSTLWEKISTEFDKKETK